jgi:pimeloyl-ACP methyl ester carboxylesterase
VTALAWLAAIVAQLALGLWMAVVWGASLAGCGPICFGAWAVAVCVTTIAFVQLAFVAITMLVASLTDGRHASDVAQRGVSDVLAAAMRRVWVIAHEAFVFALSQGLMAVEPWLTKRWDAASATGTTPVLLIHGVYCNRAVWWRLRRRLIEAGVGPIVAVNLEPAGAAMDTHMPAVESALLRLHSLAPRAPVSIVAHSMGGLVARRALTTLASEASRVARLVTIATPHAGSVHAWLCASSACREMRPQSAWLKRLQSAPHPVPIVSIYSVDDNLVAPRSTPIVLGAKAVPFRALGHFGLLWSRRVSEAVIAELLATFATANTANAASQVA